MQASPPVQEVHSLICHRDVDMALMCLSSLHTFSQEPLRSVLHDDGSLTPEDVAKLQQGLPGVTIISRAEADELLASLLRNYPYCTNFRCASVLGLKLFDVVLLGQGNMAYCDTDILFFRPFSRLFQLPDNQTSIIFMHDYQDSYSLKPWQLGDLKLLSRVNAGLVFLQKTAYDLDFIEHLLIDNEPRFTYTGHRGWWQEQTCWSALGVRIGARMWDARQIPVLQTSSKFTKDLVGGHFVSLVRHRIDEFRTHAQTINPQAVPVPIRTVPSRPYNLLNWAQVRATRRIERLFA